MVVLTGLTLVGGAHTFASYSVNRNSEYDDIAQMIRNNIAIVHKILSELPNMNVYTDVGYSRSIWQMDVNNNYVLQVAMPGVPKDKAIISVEDHRLIVKGTAENAFFKPKEKEAAKEQRSYAFEYLLPPESEVDKIEAQMENGLLTVIVPKLAKTKPKAISVK